MLYNLIDLQEVDSKLQALEALKGNLPQQVESLQAELRENEANLNDLRGKLEDLKKSKMRWEVEVKSYEEDLKKYQNQLYAVKSNKEYDAITLEIDATSEKIDDSETKIIESFEAEEHISEDIKSLTSRLNEIRERLADKEKELTVRIQETETDFNMLKKKRGELVSHISKPILHHYERIRKGKGGSAVVEVNRYACAGCFSAIPPQKVMEVRAMNQFILCESCGRILINKTHNEAVTS
ncbi:MAG: zinc ribbon domain-containing protein [bacterium]